METFVNTRLLRLDLNMPDYRTLIEDQSGNNYNFMVAGDTTVDPIQVHNQGLYFDGTNTAYSSTAALLTRSSFTMELWFRPYQDLATGQYLVRKASVIHILT